MVTTTDMIEREMVVAHPLQEVWRALTDAAALAQWFGDSAEVELHPGGKANFGWSEFGAAISGRVEVVDPPHTFAFRWAAVEGVPVDDAPSTLVTFTLTADDGTTVVRVEETGFDELPAELRQKTLEENTSGWKAEFSDLEEFLDGSAG